MNPTHFMVSFLVATNVEVGKGRMVVCVDTLYGDADVSKEVDDFSCEGNGIAIAKPSHHLEVAYLTNDVDGGELVCF